MMKNYLIRTVLWCTVAALCFGQTDFSRGEELFMQNKPQEAAIYLENAVAANPTDAKAFLYLGIVYEQLDRPDEAIAAYRRILPGAGNLTAHVAGNLGNVYFRKGNAGEAESFYTQALDADRAYASAYLGRANVRIKSGSLKTALGDYERYLLLEPRSPKRERVEQLVMLLRTEIAEEERRKILAEELARAEAERKQRLLDEVSASLQSAAGASQGLSTGAEDVEGYEGEFELE
jgi:tetratricopeptide (TPR) repeat protein